MKEGGRSDQERAPGTRADVCLMLGILLTIAFAIAPLLRGAAVPHWDANQCFAPYHAFIADFARHGELVIWNPWSMGGSPDFAEPQLGTLSPLLVLTGLVTGGGLGGFAVYWMTLWLLAAIGVQLLARSWGVSPLHGAVAGLGYAFSGVFTGHAEHVSVLLSATALPFVVWRLDAALLRCSLLAALEAGGILGQSALGGYPGLTILTACFMGVWALARVLAPEPNSELGRRVRAQRWIVAARSVSIAGGTAAVVLAPSYVGFFHEAAGQTNRVLGLSLSDALTNSLAPGALATLASPYLPRLALYNPGLWGDNDVSSASVYVGPLVTVLAASAVLVAPRSKWRLFLAAAAAASLVLSLGQVLPARRWIDELMPVFRFFRHPSMTRVFFVFCLVALALEALKPEPDSSSPLGQRRRDAVRFAVAIIACPLAIFAFRHTILGAPERGPEVDMAEWHYLGVWVATAVLAGLGWRGVFRRRAALAAVLVGVVAFTDAGFNGYLSRPITLETDPGQRRIWQELLAKRDSSTTLHSLHRSFVPPVGQGNHNLLLKVPVLKSYSAFTQSWYRAWLEEGVLRHAAVGAARVHFSRDAASLPLDDRAFDRFKARARELGALPLVVDARTEHEPASGDLGLIPGAEPLPTELEAYSARRLTFEVTAPGPGWLLVTDRWAPGWTAEVDGVPTEVRRGAFLFRALRVPAGRVRVDFSYRPFGYPTTVILSWLVLLATALARVVVTRIRKNGTRANGSDAVVC